MNTPTPTNGNNQGWYIGGCGCLVLIVLLIGGCAIGVLGHMGASNGLGVTRSTINAWHEAVARACDKASAYTKLAISAENSGAHQKAYDDSVAGLARVGGCDDEDQQNELRGYLLSQKALSEHHLSSGDSATDLNQAITLLKKCQTAYHGSQNGAGCETEEETLISHKTQWER